MARTQRDSAMSRVWVSKATFSDDTSVEFGPNDIVVFVGPNNVGKSAALKEINALLRFSNHSGKVVKSIDMVKEGSTDDLINFLERIGKKTTGSHPLPVISGLDFTIYEGNARAWWEQTNGLGELVSVFARLLNTEGRLTAANPAPNIPLLRQPPTHPIHYMVRDDNVEKRFSDYFREAFGTDLIVHRNAGNEVPLYVGDRPVPEHGEDRVSLSYTAKIEALPQLHEQGDGMRSFVGVLLNTFLESHSILLVDEPEAFLHPPQARLLGRMIAGDLPQKKQLFFSTHSGDFLRGLLDAGVNNLKIIGIKREGDINHVSVLSPSDISTLWSDPLLLHSNVLEGLFHARVIACESDADCRFYSAVLDSLDAPVGGRGKPDIMFTHCGGKHRIPTVIGALKKVGVPISAIIDFDVLNDIKPLKTAIEALGGEWAAVESDWRLVKNAIESKRPQLNTEDAKREIARILAAITEVNMPEKSVQELQSVLKKTSAWAEAKQSGLSYVPNGDATQACKRILEYCRSIHLHIVQVGELESFVKSIGNHGPKWVNEVLTRNLREDPELETARVFVKEVVTQLP